MKCNCTAIIDSKMKIDDLIDCVRILGSDIHVIGNECFLEYEGRREDVEKNDKLVRKIPKTLGEHL